MPDFVRHHCQSRSLSEPAGGPKGPGTGVNGAPVELQSRPLSESADEGARPSLAVTVRPMLWAFLGHAQKGRWDVQAGVGYDAIFCQPPK